MNASEYDFVLVFNVKIKSRSGSKAIAKGIPPEIGTYMVQKGKWEPSLGRETSYEGLQDCEKLMNDRSISQEQWAVWKDS